MIRKCIQIIPNAIFISTSLAVSHLADFADHCIAVGNEQEVSITVEGNAIQVEAIQLSYDTHTAGKEEISNKGYVVTIGGIKVFLTGVISSIPDIRQYILSN